MTHVEMRRFTPFASWPRFSRDAEPTPELRDDSARREYLDRMLSADDNGCASEAGAMALMAMFPREF